MTGWYYAERDEDHQASMAHYWKDGRALCRNAPVSMARALKATSPGAMLTCFICQRVLRNR